MSAAPKTPQPHDAPVASSAETSVETVRKVAQLARLDLAVEEEDALAGQFATILQHFQVLARLDVSGVEAMVGGSRASDVFREDTPRPSLPVEDMLRNAPAHTAEFYVVPKTVGGSSMDAAPATDEPAGGES
jgi:aspartyl-tRNA(Asn)/glutamyl-tRNA(Gln) amidotransferase subunit C